MIKAYVDGSYDRRKSHYAGWAYLILTDEEIEDYGITKEVAESWNINGEIEAVIQVINKAVSLGIKELNIHHDYNGIEKWAKGKWKAKSKVGQDYQRFILSTHDKIKLQFTKVKSHSGDVHNDRVDFLASIGLNENGGNFNIFNTERFNNF